MKVVLQRPPTYPRRKRPRLEEMYYATEGDLGKVQHEDGDAPLLVRVVEVHHAFFVHGLDAKRDPGNDDGESYVTKRHVSLDAAIRAGSMNDAPRPNWMNQCSLNQNGLNVLIRRAMIAPIGSKIKKPVIHNTA